MQIRLMEDPEIMSEPEKSRILVVDDQLAALKGVSRLLRNSGYETAEAATGAEALRLAKEFRPDLILLDVVLPDIEGTEVCKTIKADSDLANIHVVLLSGSRRDPIAKRKAWTSERKVTSFARYRIGSFCPE